MVWEGYFLDKLMLVYVVPFPFTVVSVWLEVILGYDVL
jgi:hypothetical protein